MMIPLGLARAMTPRNLTLLGLTLQTTGTLCLTIQAWGPPLYRLIGREFAFRAGDGVLIDTRKPELWPSIIGIGLLVYAVGYWPLLVAVWMTP